MIITNPLFINVTKIFHIFELQKLKIFISYGIFDEKGLYNSIKEQIFMKTLFIEAKSTKDIIPAVRRALKLLKGKIGLVSTIQHKHKLEEAKEFLEKNNIKSVIGGSVLGCDVSSAKKIKGVISNAHI